MFYSILYKINIARIIIIQTNHKCLVDINSYVDVLTMHISLKKQFYMSLKNSSCMLNLRLKNSIGSEAR